MEGKQFTDLIKASILKDSDIIAVHDGNGLKKSSMGDVTTYMSDKFSNPNLLVNPDFKINQRGSSSYTSADSSSSKYTVDRWKIYNATLNASTLVLSNPNSEGGWLLQSLENVLTGTFTVTINVASVTGIVKILYQDERASQTGVSISKGINTYTFTASNLKWVGVYVANNASVQLNYMKLEKGAVATSFITPNQAEEYLKCKRFYQRVSLDLNPISLTNGQGFVPLNLETALRSTPTVSYLINKIAVKKTYIDMTVEMLQFNKAWMSGSNVLAFEFTTSNNRISLIINNGQGIGDIALDAEIY